MPTNKEQSLDRQRLQYILNEYFKPELTRLQGQRNPIERAFYSQTLEPGALFGAANTAAQGYARQLFQPGGEVASLISKARGGAISQGFAPSSSEGAQRAILQGATNRISDVFSQNAAQLEGLRFGALSGAYGDVNASVRDLIESLFTGTASIQQLKLAQQSL